MTFTDRTVSTAFTKARGQCERCQTRLNLNSRGTQWEAYGKVSFDDGGTDEPENCQILCLACHNAIPK
jgi:hypothetical protein